MQVAFIKFNLYISGSPIHQKMAQEQSVRHPLSECSSPVHQFYPSLPEAVTLQDLQIFSASRDSTLGLTPDNFSPQNFSSCDGTNRSTSYVYDTLNRSPVHSSKFTTNPNNNMGSPINSPLYGQVSNLGLYSGNNSPILSSLISPNTSPVFGGYNQATPGSSVSSITQGIIDIKINEYHSSKSRSNIFM